MEKVTSGLKDKQIFLKVLEREIEEVSLFR